MVYRIERGRCIMCGACMVYCPVGAIVRAEKRAFIRPELCTGCGCCVCRCLTRAIRPAEGSGREPEPSASK